MDVGDKSFILKFSPSSNIISRLFSLGYLIKEENGNEILAWDEESLEQVDHAKLVIHEVRENSYHRENVYDSFIGKLFKDHYRDVFYKQARYDALRSGQISSYEISGQNGIPAVCLKYNP